MEFATEVKNWLLYLFLSFKKGFTLVPSSLLKVIYSYTLYSLFLFLAVDACLKMYFLPKLHNSF